MRRLALLALVVSTLAAPARADFTPVVGPVARPRALVLGGSPRVEPDGLGSAKAPAPATSTVKLQIPINNAFDVPLSGTVTVAHGGATTSELVTVPPSSVRYVTFLVAPYGPVLPPKGLPPSTCLQKPAPVQVTLSAQPQRQLALEAACTYKTSIDDPLWKVSPDTAESWTKDRAFIRTVAFVAPASCSDPFSIVASVTNGTKALGKDLYLGVSPVAPPSQPDPSAPVIASKGVTSAPFSVAASTTKPNIPVGVGVTSESEIFHVTLHDAQGSLGGKIYNAGIKATAARTCVFTPAWVP